MKGKQDALRNHMSKYIWPGAGVDLTSELI